jgi:hypothetical protein
MSKEQNMGHATIWLNTHFNCIQSVRAADDAREFRIICSYPERKYAEVLLADAFEMEPAGVRSHYAEYALDFCRRHAVDVFIPGRRMREIAMHLADFEALGVKVVLVGDADLLDLLDDKGKFFDTLEPGLVPLPEYRTANNLEDFVRHVTALQARHDVVCFKPTVGIFGYGFQAVLTDTNRPLLGGLDSKLITPLSAARKALAASFKPQMVMEYLPGEERSVDCLAANGVLLSSVVRSKMPDGSRLLEDNPNLQEMVGRLTKALRLHGLFNVQFKDKNGTPFLLEINARMSGGISLSCLSGVSLPYWAARVALDPLAAQPIPQPRTGLRVAELSQAIVLGES